MDEQGRVSIASDEITLREIRFMIEEPGRKQEAFIVATTMLDPQVEAAVTKDQIAELYG